MTFQLKRQFKLVVDELVIDWVRSNYDEIFATVRGKYVDDEDERNDAILFELFNSHDKSFGKYCKSSKKVKKSHLVQIIQYIHSIEKEYIGCGAEFDWTKYHDIEYLCGQMGYFYGVENKDAVINLFDSIGDAPILK